MSDIIYNPDPNELMIPDCCAPQHEPIIFALSNQEIRCLLDAILKSFLHILTAFLVFSSAFLKSFLLLCHSYQLDWIQA